MPIQAVTPAAGATTAHRVSSGVKAR